MKHLFFLILIFLLFPNQTISVKANTNNFAQIQKSNVYIYTSNFEPIFELPYSYYVKLLSPSEGEYYSCEYNGITGYVKKNEIQCCASLTETPYLQNVSFRILGSQSAELRSEPSKKKGLSTLLTELDLYETNFTYLGKLQGDEVVPGRGDIWYYAKYSKNNITLTGYVYAGLCDQLSAIPILSINPTPIDVHTWVEEQPEEIIPETPQFVLPEKNELLIIAIVSIPIIILLSLLIFNKKSKNVTTQNIDLSNVVTMKPKKAKRGRDYYELE